MRAFRYLDVFSLYLDSFALIAAAFGETYSEVLTADSVKKLPDSTNWTGTALFTK